MSKHSEFFSKSNASLHFNCFSFSYSSSLVYIITNKPSQGHFENIQDKRYVRRSFSQKDIDDGSLLYVIDRHAKKYTDSFRFRIEDIRGNKLNNQS